MHKNTKDISGLRFGRLTVVSVCKKRNASGKIKWVCVCDCGKEILVISSQLLGGRTRSCGCYKLHFRMTHNMSTSKEYRAWADIKKRCYNKNHSHYKNYGGRGITMCDRWVNSFQTFYYDMGKRPSKNHSLDRYPDINGNYEPSNCRWATIKQQVRGKTNNKWIEYNGLRMISADWAGKLKISRSQFSYLINRKTMEQIMSKYQK